MEQIKAGPAAEPAGAELKTDSKQSGKSGLISAAVAAERDLREGKLLSKKVSETASAVGVVKDRVKAASSLAKYGIEALESVAAPLLSPVMAKVDSVVVKNIDAISSSAYNKLLSVGGAIYRRAESKDSKQAASASSNIFKGLVVSPEWFAEVDRIVNPAGITAANLVSRFNKAAAAEFKRLVSAAQSAKIECEVFVAGLRREMQEAWDQNLRAPAVAFFEAAKAELANARAAAQGAEVPSLAEILAALEPVWNEQVKSIYEARINPAIVVYTSALRMFKRYRDVAEEKGLKVSFQAFLVEVRTQLGREYDERLATHFRDFYGGASKLVRADLDRVVEALDFDCDKKVTLNDFWLRGTSVGNAVVRQFVKAPYQTLLRTTMRVADNIFPARTGAKNDALSGGGGDDAKAAEGAGAVNNCDAATIAEDLSLSLVTTTISKRLVKRAVGGLVNLRRRAQTLVGPDLIQYANDLVDDVKQSRLTAAAAQATTATAQALQDSVASLRTSAERLNAFLSERVGRPAQDATRQLMQSERAQELRRRFAEAVGRAQNFASRGSTYLLNRELRLLPVDLGKFFATSVGLSENNPDLRFAKYYTKVVDLVSDLVVSIFDVVRIVSWRRDEKVVSKGAEQSEEKASTAGTGPADAAEETKGNGAVVEDPEPEQDQEPEAEQDDEPEPEQDEDGDDIVEA